MVGSNARNNRPKWFTPQLYKLREFVLMLRDRACLSDRGRNLYVKARGFYKKKIKSAKICANENFILSANNSCKAAWTVIKAESGMAVERFTPDISPDVFNDYFLNCVLTNESANNEPVNLSAQDMLTSVHECLHRPNFKFFLCQSQADITCS